MAAAFSDEELRAKLKEFGEDIGPITDSTRVLWQKKLDRLLADKKSQRRKSQVTQPAPLAQYSSDDSEADCRRNAKLDRPLPRSRRRTSSKSAAETSSIYVEKNSADGDFKKPSGTPKSWRGSRQATASQESLPKLARPSLRSLSSNTGRSNGVVPDFESSDSDIDEPSTRRSLRSSKRQVQGNSHRVDGSSIGSSAPATRSSKRNESSESSEMNDSSGLWEGKGAANKQPKNNLAPEKAKRGRKRKASQKMVADVQESVANQLPLKKPARQEQIKECEVAEKDSVTRAHISPKKDHVQEHHSRQFSDEPMTVDSTEEELHMKNLQFIQLQMELARAEHAMKLQLAQKEHEYKMQQLQLMMREYREKLSLPLSP